MALPASSVGDHIQDNSLREILGQPHLASPTIWLSCLGIVNKRQHRPRLVTGLSARSRTIFVFITLEMQPHPARLHLKH
jgi:hypothetical protein